MEGVLKASKHPKGFIPFSTRPHYCIKQKFAIMEVKIVMAMVLSHFQLSICPNYEHSPAG
jgi:PHYB activation tagged suppressor 1